MINPAFDVWVWATGLLFLVLMGVRAYVVETGQVRLGGTPAAARLLTMAIFLVLIGLGGLLALQGGTLLVSSIVNHTDPSLIPNVVLTRPHLRPTRPHPHRHRHLLPGPLRHLLRHPLRLRLRHPLRHRPPPTDLPSAPL